VQAAQSCLKFYHRLNLQVLLAMFEGCAAAVHDCGQFRFFAVPDNYSA
jgi:hypothetical protein